MGVAGAGKTLIGSMLAEHLKWEFADADDFHPPANIEKMSHGIPLTDADREPWLRSMRALIEAWAEAGQNGVLACSALKRRYRDELTRGVESKTVFLKGTPELIHSRLLLRRGHYMKAEMLASQFSDLEEPGDAIVVDVSTPPETVLAEIISNL
jgi:gluconokinase